MKKIINLLFFISFITYGQVTIAPNPFEVDQQITITVDLNSTATDCNGLSNPAKIYMHSGIGDDNDPWGYNVVGNWGQDDGIGEMTNNNNGTWSISITPETYYGLSTAQAQSAIRMGMVFRNANGTQELKASGCTDFFFDVGTFQVSLSNPDQDSVTILNSGENLNITASNIGGPANYVLKANGNILNTQNSISSYTYTHSNITSNQSYNLEVTLNGTTIIKEFSALINPGSITGFMPTTYKDGITYISDTEAVLVLYASGKNFVYVAGSFNNWQPDSSYAMKYDPSRQKFWITLSGLTAGQIETYQYWVADTTPPTNSPVLVKIADPYSTLVLSPFDDPFIPASSYPNIPAYPAGQEREVTVLQTAQTPYNWQVTDFIKPKKEDLVIYEVLIRDFDKNGDGGRNFQHLIDKIDYFKNLNVNAIQLMPIMEYEGNESWGYNTSFHMALDKYYGTEDKLKEFIDLCHQNGIAVILDVALNHAFGRNPMVRMWMNDSDNDGWGEPSSENPYFNEVATHSYSVGSDFDHSNGFTKQYTKRVVEHWINEFKIDGFRWDLTKGFTQQCTAGDDFCTNAYRSDRVAILKEYADHSWLQDDTHYVIFEHLGGNQEEKEWADYRVGEGKGIMLWGKMTENYNQLTMGYNSSNDISGVGHDSRNFIAPRLVGYAESHDEERLMYKNLQFGNQSNTSHDVRDLNTALSRMSALGAVTLTVPGPKMIWHFGALGMENSIFTCNNGTVNEPGGNDGDCKLDTKPQPQWADNWLGDINRSKIYSDWARINLLKTAEAVFEGNYSINQTDNSVTPKIYIWDDALPANELKNVVILANFDVNSQNVTPDFPYNGTWYDLMDDTGATSISVSNTAAAISIAPGQFKIYGNTSAQLLNIDVFTLEAAMTIFPNPAQTAFSLNSEIEKLSIYDVTGKLIKSFTGGFNKGYTFNIDYISKGLYLVQIENKLGAISTTKLIKL